MLLEALFISAISMAAPTAAKETPPAPVPVHDILDNGAMNRKADPCENFYEYSCGTWLKNFKLPADKSRYWRQGGVLSDNVEVTLNKILSDLPKVEKVEPGAKNETKLAAFYQSCMAVPADDKAGLETVKGQLKEYDAINDAKTLAQVLGRFTLKGGSGFFELYPDQDLKDSNQVITFIDRGGMSLPDPDYYLKDDAKSKEVRKKFKEHVAKTLVIVGEAPKAAAATADKVLAFETELAKHSLKLDDRRDVEKLFHPMKYEEVKALVPAFEWDEYLKAMDLKTPKKININEPAFMKKVNEMLASANYADLVAHLKYRFARSAAYYVPGPLQNEEFRFWRAYLNGQKSLPPRWKYCTRIVAEDMNEALGQAYLASVPNAKEIRKGTEKMVEQIKTAFKAELDRLEWMDDKTRKEAHKKLKKVGGKIGWPDKWRDYGPMKIEAGPLINNLLAATEFETRRHLNKIDKKVDRSEWYMSTWEPNAYYTGSNNEMVLPLGETVPPVFDPKFNDGPNLAVLGGSTIGHELLHGFDDSGKDMDADGNFVTWWTAESKKKFEDMSQCYIKQTEAYPIMPGTKNFIRGKATLGENLADNGGVKLGILVMKELLKTRAMGPKWQEFDEMQQFFVAYAQSWCMKVTPQSARERLLTDYHPPAEFRVNQVIANQPEFAEAFKCKEGSRMAPKVRCSLW